MLDVHRLVILRLHPRTISCPKYQLLFDWQLEFSSITVQYSISDVCCSALGPFVVIKLSPSDRLVVNPRDHSVYTLANLNFTPYHDASTDTSILLLPDWIAKPIATDNFIHLLKTQGTICRFNFFTKKIEPTLQLPEILFQYVPKARPYVHGERVARDAGQRELVLPEQISISVFVYGASRVVVNIRNASRVRNGGEAVLVQLDAQ